MPDWDTENGLNSWHSINIYDTPFAVQKNCYQMHYDEDQSAPIDISCQEDGVAVRIAVDDPVDPEDPDNMNVSPIKEP